MADLGFAAANGLAFLLCVMFLGYVSLIFVPYFRHRPSAPGNDDLFQWHFLVPCMDEQAVVEKTVRGLLDTFPAAQIWTVDDASEDTTLAILRRLERQDTRVHVVARTQPEARQGKGAALNAGWRAIDEALPVGQPRELVMVSVVDADAVLDDHVLKMVAGPAFFGDPAVGAVQIQVRVRPDPFRPMDDQPSIPRRQRLLIALQDLEFTGPIAAMQMLRSKTGSVAMGGNGQFTRLSVLNDVADRHGTPWHGALLEDFELGLHVLLAGSRTAYCHDASVIQEGVPRVKPLVRQRSRWAQGSMQCLSYLREILRTRHLTAGGTLEIAYFLFSPWVQLVGGVVYATLFSSAAYYAATDPLGVGHWWGGGAWGLVPLFLLFGVSPFLIWAFMYRSRVRPELSLWRALGLGVANAFYVYFHQAATWWAFYRVMTARTDWKKTVRYSQQAVDAALDLLFRPSVRPPSEALARLRGSRAPVTSRPQRATTTVAPGPAPALSRLRREDVTPLPSFITERDEIALGGLRRASRMPQDGAFAGVHKPRVDALRYGPISPPTSPEQRVPDAVRGSATVTASH